MTSYATDHDGALADILAAGASVTFYRTDGQTYDPTTDTFSGGHTTNVAGAAMRVEGDPMKYAALSLVQSESPTLLFCPTTYGDNFPPLGASVIWGGIQYIVKDVEPLDPNGSGAIIAHVIIAAGGPVPGEAPILDQSGWLL